MVTMRVVGSATVAVVTLLLVSQGATAQEEVYLRVTSPGLQRVVMAIPPPVLRPGADQVASDTFVAALTRDLGATAVLSLLPDAVIRSVVPAPNDPARARSQFREAGAQFLLDDSIASSGNQLVAEVRLWDLTSGEVAYSRRLQAAATLAPTMAHTLANEILRLFTGKPGPFLSRIAFISDRSGAKELWVMRWDGSEAQQLTAHKSIAMAPAWSADGQWLAFTSFMRGQPQLFLLKPTQGYLRPLSTIPGVNTSPSFSPDGSQVAFAAGDGGNTDIYVVPVSGGEPQRLTASRAIDTQPAWSPNGRQIAFTSTAAGSPQLYLMDAEGTNVRRLTLEDRFADEAAWAPDGVRLAYTTWVEDRFQIATLDVRTGRRDVIAGPGSNESPCWSPDGTMLAFVSNRAGSKQIFVTDAAGNPQQLTRDGNNQQPSWVAQVQ
jgi:TolB protein